MARHTDVLTDDIAARFLVGLGTADKAYQGLRSMVDWVEAQGVAHLVRQPQPRFELIKKHYPQVSGGVPPVGGLVVGREQMQTQQVGRAPACADH